MKVLCKKDFYYPQPERPIYDLSFLVFKEGEYYNCVEIDNQYLIYVYGLYKYGSKSFHFLKKFVYSAPFLSHPAVYNLWYFEDYFYTQKDVRKFKLNKIKNEIKNESSM
jgi:hypothetical protein